MKKVAKGLIVIHRSIDSAEIDAREGAAMKDEKAATEKARPYSFARFTTRKLLLRFYAVDVRGISGKRGVPQRYIEYF